MITQEKMNRAYLDGAQHPSFAPYRHHVGITEKTIHGKITCYQLLNEQGKSVAIADFVDGILFRSILIPQVEREAFAWLEYCKELQKKNVKKKIDAGNVYDF